MLNKGLIKFIDIGCSIQFDNSLRALIDDEVVEKIGFEANLNLFNDLKKADPDSKIYHKAISNTVGNIDFYVNQISKTISSTKKKYFDISWEENYKRTTVQSDTIDNLVAKNVIPSIDFLKIDVEGGEINVLLGAKEQLANVLGIKIEFSFNAEAGQNGFSEIDKILRDNGFKIYGICFDENVNTGPGGGDLLYLKLPQSVIKNKNKESKENILNKLNKLSFISNKLRRYEFSALIIEALGGLEITTKNRDFFISNSLEKIHIPSKLRFSFEKLSHIFALLGIFFSGSNYSAKSSLKLNRLVPSKYLFIKNLCSEKTRKKQFNLISKKTKSFIKKNNI